MTIEQLRYLSEVIREAIDTNPRAATHVVVRWIWDHYPHVIDENELTLINDGLGDRIRREHKARPPLGEITEFSLHLCFDFGLPPIQFDEEISVPRDIENLINSPCDWPSLEETTIRDFDKHILLLRATAKATLEHADNCEQLRQAAMRHNPDGNLDITIGKLRAIARGEKN